jgi:ABC-type Na+ efflux pump permease subunit
MRLLLRDPKAAIILLVMPLLFILVLGVSLGEGFGQKPDDRLRLSIVDLDQGYQLDQWPHEAWSKRVLRDLSQSEEHIRVELIASREEARQLVDNGKRAAVILFGPNFSERVQRSSFLAGGINPFFREGVDTEILDIEVLEDPTQLTAASIIKQVAQGTLLRVVLPWMIGQAFSKIGEPAFVDQLSNNPDLKVKLPLGLDLRTVLKSFTPAQKQALAQGMQSSVQRLFPRYDLTAKEWTSLTRSTPHAGLPRDPSIYKPEGAGFLNRGAMRYQLLVPSYTVMFAFFLVLTMGWLFVSERRQGTLKRLSVAPLTRVQIVLGKLLPCLLLSLFQGFFLLAAGKLLFAMDWGPQPLWLIPVVVATSLAAMGLALLVAALARTETQVAIYGTLLVLVLAGVSGILMGDRSLMPEQMQEFSRITPHAWALDAYRQLLANPGIPNYLLVAQSCLVLAGFGVGFLVLAWWWLKLE